MDEPRHGKLLSSQQFVDGVNRAITEQNDELAKRQATDSNTLVDYRAECVRLSRDLADRTRERDEAFDILKAITIAWNARHLSIRPMEELAGMARRLVKGATDAT